MTWRVWAYALDAEFASVDAAFADVLVRGPWQRHATAHRAALGAAA